ncbi:uncharacterized protein LOC114300792 isoform X1 [Camellia sinensis]|uniref:uncharacterized protein LOC114300792 isoform X1 n=1 Tax=Camellia sinensis TaxID=4442 RepID=UPI0010355F05|nr:uncharacterized protein LOC114300792 isoform X1 [Camellia sinensis]
MSLILHHPLIQVIQREPWEHINDEDIKKTDASFCGEIWQVPPMFSAIKVSFSPSFCYKLAETGRESLQKNGISVPNEFCHTMKVGGEKMYEKARRGESIELPPRRISIFQFDIKRSLDDRQNLIFWVTCSKGTYIRSLCADLWKALNRFTYQRKKRKRRRRSRYDKLNEKKAVGVN